MLRCDIVVLRDVALLHLFEVHAIIRQFGVKGVEFGGASAYLREVLGDVVFDLADDTTSFELEIVALSGFALFLPEDVELLDEDHEHVQVHIAIFDCTFLEMTIRSGKLLDVEEVELLKVLLHLELLALHTQQRLLLRFLRIH
jgi:hypothetical protein